MSKSRPALPPLAIAALLGVAACGEAGEAPAGRPEAAAPTDPGMAGEAAATGATAPADETTPPADATATPDAPAPDEGTRWDRGGGDPVPDGVPPEAPEKLPPTNDVAPEVVREKPDMGAPPPARPPDEPM